MHRMRFRDAVITSLRKFCYLSRDLHSTSFIFCISFGSFEVDQHLLCAPVLVCTRDSFFHFSTDDFSRGVSITHSIFGDPRFEYIVLLE